MGVVMFYHLTRSGADATLAALIGRARARDWRVMVRGANDARLAQLDDHLWQHPGDGFVAHGREGGPHDADQPVLLGRGPATNRADALALIDGAAPAPDEIGAYLRIWVIFDGGDAAAVDAARGLWRQVAAAGHPAQYWAEDGGSWQMKTQIPQAGAPR